MGTDFFHNRKPRPDILLKCGFQNEDGIFFRTTDLLDGQFQMTVFISDGGEVKTKVIDLASGDEYMLFRIADAIGAFVGRVREAHDKELASIAEHCFEPDVFKSDDARKVIRYVRETYQDELEFLWKKFSGNAVLRRKETGKWYAALLSVSQRKLGLDDDSVIEIIDLRVDPEESAALWDGTKYFPGYHMNKRNWITIRLNGSVPPAEIYRRIDASYRLALK